MMIRAGLSGILELSMFISPRHYFQELAELNNPAARLEGPRDRNIKEPLISSYALEARSHLPTWKAGSM
jgi:hypothetical protein